MAGKVDAQFASGHQRVWHCGGARLQSRQPAAKAALHMSTLVVWDFDWSLCNENTDTFVIRSVGWAVEATSASCTLSFRLAFKLVGCREIGAWDVYEKLKSEGLPWTVLMDATLEAAHIRLGVTEAVIRQAVARTPLDPAVAEVLWQTSGATRVQTLACSSRLLTIAYVYLMPEACA